jgi:hypothetical protein
MGNSDGLFESFEEISFAKVKYNPIYVIIHSIFNGTILSPIKSKHIKNLSYDNFSWYLQGACFGKDNKKIHLYNGLASDINNNSFFDKKLSSLKEKELEKLLFETGLKEEFGNSVKTIK